MKNIDIIEEMHKNKAIKKAKNWNIFGIIIAVILFVCMCTKGALYEYLWQNELYKILGILTPIAAIIPIVASVLLLSCKFKQMRVIQSSLYALAFVLLLIEYIIVVGNTGDHTSQPEFYARRFFAIWGMLNLIITCFISRVLK